MTGVYWWDPWHKKKAAPLGSFGADHGNRKPTWQSVKGAPVFHIMRTQRKMGLPSDKWLSMITSMITSMTINVNFQWGYLSMCCSPKTPQSWFLGFSWATFDALKDLGTRARPRPHCVGFAHLMCFQDSGTGNTWAGEHQWWRGGVNNQHELYICILYIYIQ